MTADTPPNKIIILVVEDDDISYFLISEILSSIGMKAVRATSKSEVLNLVASEDDFQMIIMDVILNGSENGYAIANELASMHVDLPIMIVSAWATAVLEPDRSQIKNIKQVMDKPFNVEQFKKLLLQTIQK